MKELPGQGDLYMQTLGMHIHITHMHIHTVMHMIPSPACKGLAGCPGTVMSAYMDRAPKQQARLALKVRRHEVPSLPQYGAGHLRHQEPQEGKDPRPFLDFQLTPPCSAPLPQVGEPHLVICMDCSADTMTNRLLQRSQSSQRGEDTARTIAKRLEAYHRASIPVIAYYETKTQLRKVRLIFKWAVHSFRLRKERHTFLWDLGTLQAATGVRTEQELLSSLAVVSIKGE